MRNPTVSPQKNQKTFLMIGGVIVIGVVAVLMYMKNKRAQEKAESDKIDELERMALEEELFATHTQVEPAYIPPLRRIEVGKSKSGNWVGIKSSSRSKASDSLDIGDEGMINERIPCIVSDFWMDKNGKKGAFKCEGMEYYDIPNGSRFEW